MAMYVKMCVIVFVWMTVYVVVIFMCVNVYISAYLREGCV